MEEQLTKQQRREFKRQMRAEKLATLGKSKNMSSLLWTSLFVIVIGGLFAYILLDIFRPLAGTKVPLLDRNHVPETQSVEYNSVPPTSGSHSGTTEEWGIYDRPLVMGKLIHNLEHSGIVIYYYCDDCPDIVTKLKDLTARLARRDRKIILAPYKFTQPLDTKIAVAAWGYYDKMDEYDEERISKFFDDHINRGPERVL